MKSCNTKSYDDTSEHTHLKCIDTNDACNCSLKYAFSYSTVNNHTCDVEHSFNSNVHYEESDHSCKSCNFLFLLCHTDGNTYCKDKRKVTEDGTSDRIHDV